MNKFFVKKLLWDIYAVAVTIVLLLNGRLACGQEGTDPLNANEQVKVTMGKEEVIRSVDMLPRFFGNDDTSYYALTRKSRTGIARYGRSMDKTGEGFIAVNEDLKTREIVDIIHFHDSIYLFFATEGLNRRTLHVKNISKSTLEEGESSQVVFSFPFVRGRKPLYGVRLSRDRSRLLIYSRIILHSQKQGLLEMKVCGAGLSTEWSNSFQFSFIRAPRHMNRFRVDKWGNVYMLDYLYDPPVLNITGRPNKLMLLAVTENGKRSGTTELSIPEMYIKNAEIEPAGHDAVICAGFFSDNQLEGTIRGSFYFRVNAIYHFIRNYREYLLPMSDFSQGESFGLFVNHLVYKQDGYAFLVAEQYFREEHKRYQNLYISLFMDDGELAWERVIPKEQSYRVRTITANRDYSHRIAPREYWPDGTPVYNPQADRERFEGHDYDVTDDWDRKYPGQEWDYGSFALASPLDHPWIALVFNDNLKNLEGRRKKRAVFSSGARSYLSVIKIDRYGNMNTFHPYVRDKKRKPIPLPSFYHDTQTGKIVFPAARRNNTFQMMELTLKQP